MQRNIDMIAHGNDGADTLAHERHDERARVSAPAGPVQGRAWSGLR
jgi:hypothetical protein